MAHFRRLVSETAARNLLKEADRNISREAKRVASEISRDEKSIAFLTVGLVKALQKDDRAIAFPGYAQQLRDAVGRVKSSISDVQIILEEIVEEYK